MPDNRLKIKVCGMRDSENMRALATLHPDFVGFIFYEKSPRYALNNLQFTTNDLQFSNSKKVGVFVNESVEKMLTLAKQYQLDFVQLHGDETPLQCLNLLNEDLGVIKVFSIAEVADFAQTEAYEGCCDYFLFDTKISPKEELRGGTGQKFDWAILNDYQGNTPFLLSGGISADDAETVLKITHNQFAGVDLNSRFELEAGLKNIEKIKTFIEEITQ